jgi:hypothetical protein
MPASANLLLSYERGEKIRVTAYDLPGRCVAWGCSGVATRLAAVPWSPLPGLLPAALSPFVAIAAVGLPPAWVRREQLTGRDV